MKKILIKVGSEEKTVKEYIESIYTEDAYKEKASERPFIGTGHLISGFKFEGLDPQKVEGYDENNPRNSLRAVYIFDKQQAILGGSRILEESTSITGSDLSGSKLYQIYVAEQLPYDARLKLPNKIDFEQLATYSYIEPYVGKISIPLISNATYNYNYDYYYKLIIDGKEYDIRDSYSEEDGKIITQIPMMAVPGSGGDIYLQAISLNPNNESSSVSTSPVATIETLKEPQWGYNTNYNNYTEWKKIVDQLDGNNKTSVSNPGGYLTVSTDITDPNDPWYGIKGGNYQISTGTKNGIRLQNNTSLIRLKLYKPCKINVLANIGASYSGQDIPYLKLYKGEYSNNVADSSDSIEKTDKDPTKFVDFEIKKDYFYNNVIEIGLGRGIGTGTFIREISLLPLKEE